MILIMMLSCGDRYASIVKDKKMIKAVLSFRGRALAANTPKMTPTMAETLIPNCTRGIPSNFSRLRPISATRRQLPSFICYSPEFCDLKGRFDYLIGSFRARKWVTRAAATSSSMVEDAKEDDEPMSIGNLRRFIDLNVGKWNGSFYVSRMIALPSYFLNVSVVG